MRFVLCVVFIIWSTLAPSRSVAATFNLPLNGVFEILGDIPSPITATFNFSITPIQPVPPPTDVPPVPGFSYGAFVQQSGNFATGFFFPQTCIGASCGAFAGFVGCGLQIGCGFEFLPGFVAARGNGDDISVPITVTDTYRYFGLSGSVFTTVPLDIQFTVDIPDGLVVGFLATRFDVVPQTPLPAALPLFAIGLGAFGEIGWRRKRQQHATL